MPVKVTSDELVDFGLGSGMQVLELVHRLELDNIKTVRYDTVGFALEKVLGFVRGDVRDGCENIRTMSRGPLDTVPMVDAALASFMINVEILQIVVEVDASRAKVTSEERCVRREDCGHVDMSLTA